MPDLVNGLPNKVSEEWGYPYLRTSYTEDLVCECEFCRGCKGRRTVELPESEWEWVPQKRIVDMSDIHRLESGPSMLSSVLNPRYGVEVHKWA